ncbi:glycosyltransferase family 2 protein [Liquorilactobacillus nagelii]|uniref:glycosyltransferase family 2 protein n=1 Tax=Liquorilactobacillus nagelii TaxID=82688 RepID=UPI003C6DB66B
MKREFLDACTQRTRIVIKLHNIKNNKFRCFCDSKWLLPLGLINFIKLNFLLKKKHRYKYNLAVVAIVKNEGSYLNEWLNYYMSIGVDHCYIYDNYSSDNTVEVLKEYSDFVTYKKISGKRRQNDAYNDALNNFKNDCKLMAMIDVDEFIFCPPDNENVVPCIDSYFANPEVGGITVNWQIFGSSNFSKRPTGLVTDNFVYRSKNNFYKNKHIKTICNPRKVVGFVNPHYPIYLPRYKAVNENYNNVVGAFSREISTNLIRINHYFTKSKEEFLKKRSRGMADNLSFRQMKDFEKHDKNDIFDESLRKYNEVHHLKS